MAVCAWGSYQLLFALLNGSRMATVLAILFAIIVYAVMVLLTRTITKDEISRMPKGEKIVRILDKFIK